ncbi:hypothetical protein F0U44_04065 [Nocardioides humilatus]|uniref:Condensation domain-containing protein n=1 Tax=Nocardioides humilatus TaxID=2607660 RepID=A0A5B1LL79_9ACTN|nr:hypothetical protein [Nocardioides humilatus]KAA1421472.1 hypothetical protein F0U44_04065 [Nocardioides humilatus]
MTITRPLDPTEVYYEVVDRMWPMNALGVIELTGDHSPAEVTEAWAAVTAAVPIVGARVVRTSPREAHFDFSSPVVGEVEVHDDLLSMLATVSDTHVSLDGPLVRCAMAPGSSGGTGFALTAHHSALDGRPMVQLLFLLARALEGDDVTGHPLGAPTQGLGSFTLPERDWTGRRMEMLAVAREIRDEEGFVGNGETPAWYDRSLDGDRDLAYRLFDLTPEEGLALIRWSKSQGATVHGALTVAVLKTMGALTPGAGRLPLSTTVDLRVRAAAAAVDVVGQSAAVVSASFDVTEDPGLLARHVSEDIRRRVDRCEPELFFALSGVDKLPVGEATDKVVRRWMESATPAPNLSNLGVVTGDAPASVRRVCVGLAPTPNQVFFIATTTFRGKVTFILSFDRNRVSIDPDVFTDTLRGELAALIEEAPPAVDQQ